jgi:EAL domain-containing protein (putative c-di-GMP-specific phosphodiesterase class I)
VRWNHPVRGVLPPGEFIDIAEQSRLINAIGEWTLRESCTTLRLFEERSGQRLKMSVNLSPVQLSQPNLVERILGILEETGVRPEQLELELTESSLMENVDSARATLGKLHAAGIRISIDDFGTGYSALSYLRTLPIDTIKVDRTFVADIDSCSDDHAIVSAIVSMAGKLGLEVVAEGVESRAQLDALVAMDCAAAQGYFFSRPVPAKEAVSYLLKNQDEEPVRESRVAALP